MLRFLADESCDFAIVRALRKAGHDVSSVTELMAGATDRSVAELAKRESRILLTEDKDFGQLCLAGSGPESGVVLIRFPGSARETAVNALLELTKKAGNKLQNRFVVVQPARIRISELKGLGA